jgi:hypothetical protein
MPELSSFLGSPATPSDDKKPAKRKSFNSSKHEKSKASIKTDYVEAVSKKLKRDAKKRVRT